MIDVDKKSISLSQSYQKYNSISIGLRWREYGNDSNVAVYMYSHVLLGLKHAHITMEQNSVCTILVMALLYNATVSCVWPAAATRAAWWQCCGGTHMIADLCILLKYAA